MFLAEWTKGSPGASASRPDRRTRAKGWLNSQGRRVVAQLVEEHSKRPDVALLVDDSPLVDVDHLGRTILDRRVRVDVELDLAHLSDRRGRGTRGRDGTEVTQLERVGRGLKDVLDLR